MRAFGRYDIFRIDVKGVGRCIICTCVCILFVIVFVFEHMRGGLRPGKKCWQVHALYVTLFLSLTEHESI